MTSTKNFCITSALVLMMVVSGDGRGFFRHHCGDKRLKKKLAPLGATSKMVWSHDVTSESFLRWLPECELDEKR
jgi:hypothetical protein